MIGPWCLTSPALQNSAEDREPGPLGGSMTCRTPTPPNDTFGGWLRAPVDETREVVDRSQVMSTIGSRRAPGAASGTTVAPSDLRKPDIS